MLKKYYFLPHLIILISGLIIGSFFDFEINNAIFSERNSFGIFMAAFGEYPVYLLISFLGSYLVFYAIRFFFKKNNWLFVLLLICGLLGIGSGSYYLGNAITNSNGYLISGVMKAVWFLISFIMNLPAVFLGYYISKRGKENSWKFVILILLGIAISILITTVVKEIMHRPRFRSIIANSSIQFKNWWEPTFNYKSYINETILSEDFKSFPSGHANITTSFVVVPYLIPLFTDKKHHKTQLFLQIISCVYPLFISFTRLLVGAHFLSDVSVGGLITIITIAIFISLLDKKKLLEI